MRKSHYQSRWRPHYLVREDVVRNPSGTEDGSRRDSKKDDPPETNRLTVERIVVRGESEIATERPENQQKTKVLIADGSLGKAFIFGLEPQTLDQLIEGANTKQPHPDYLFVNRLTFKGCKGTMSRFVAHSTQDLVIDVQLPRSEMALNKPIRRAKAGEIAICVRAPFFISRYEAYESQCESALIFEGAVITPSTIRIGDYCLPNPVQYLGTIFESVLHPLGDAPFGIIHGDLHGGNILVARNSGVVIDYGLLDIDGPIGFDQAYLFGSAILDIVVPHLLDTKPLREGSAPAENSEEERPTSSESTEKQRFDTKIKLLIDLLKASMGRIIGTSNLTWELSILQLLEPARTGLSESYNGRQFLVHLFAYAFIALKWDTNKNFQRGAFILAAVVASELFGGGTTRTSTSDAASAPHDESPMRGGSVAKDGGTAGFSRDSGPRWEAAPPASEHTARTVDQSTLDEGESDGEGAHVADVTSLPGVTIVPVEEFTRHKENDCLPNFMLYRRANQLLLVISENDELIDPNALQRTNESMVKAEPASADDLLRFGIVGKRVDPFALGRLAGLISRVMIDSAIYSEAALFPCHRIVFPRYDKPDVKISFPIGQGLMALQSLFSRRKIYFVNIRKHQRLSLRLQSAVLAMPVKTRFAPSPTGGLHLGNARTAIISYLIYLKARSNPRTHDDSSFILRSDDTDTSRSKSQHAREIERQLRWMGLRWDGALSQARRHKESHYSEVIAALSDGGRIIENAAAGPLSLSAAIPEGRTFFDLRLGPITRHGPLENRHSQSKEIPILRPAEGLPYYRFAGIIDDLEFSSHVVRDISQWDLTGEQSLIRGQIEECYHSGPAELRPEVGRALRSAGAGLALLKLPIYLHVQKMVDRSGEKISKRNGEEQYSLQHFQEVRRIPPQALLIYLLSTILPGLPLACVEAESGPVQFKILRWRDQVKSLALFFADASSETGLMEAASKLDPIKLIESCRPVYYYESHLVWAEVCLLRSWSELRMAEYLRRHAGLRFSVSPEQTRAIWRHREQFPSCASICHLLESPGAPMVISPSTETWLKEIWPSKYTPVLEIRALLNRNLSALRRNGVEARPESLQNPGAEAPMSAERRRARLRCDAVQRDLRFALTGQGSGPPLSVLLDVLDEASIYQRVDAAFTAKGFPPSL